MFPLIHLAPGVSLPSYFVVISLMFVVCLFWANSRCLKRNLNLMHLYNMAFLIMVGGFLGARLMHIIYEHPEYYWAHPLQVFYVWQGGFVFYGGVLGAVAPAVFYLRRQKEDIGPWLEVFAPICAGGYILGRFATLLSGSGFGRPTDLPWGIIYPPGTEAPPGIALHPTPLYSMIWETFNLLVILKLDKIRSKFLRVGGSFWVFVFLHSVGRLLVEQFRNDFRGTDILGLSVSSWISVVLILWSLHMVFGQVWLSSTRSK